jgi:hypothetical protein
MLCKTVRRIILLLTPKGYRQKTLPCLVQGLSLQNSIKFFFKSANPRIGTFFVFNLIRKAERIYNIFINNLYKNNKI